MTDQDDEEVGWDDLQGKVILIGLTFQDARGKALRQEQKHGRIAVADRKRGLCVELHGQSESEMYWMPPDLRAIRRAPPGEYRLRSTGDVVTDPDLLATWVVTEPDG